MKPGKGLDITKPKNNVKLCDLCSENESGFPLQSINPPSVYYE